MKKIVVTILSVLTLILSSTSIVLAAPFDLTYSADSTKNYTFNQFIDRPSVFDFVAANLAGYEIEGLDGTKYNAQEINNRTMMGMTFVQAVASLHATAAVVTAEGSKLQADVDVAQALITALPVGIDKTALQDRLNIVIASMPVVPSAPSVTRNDVSDTVSGMTTAMEYNLDGAGYVAYNATVFNLLNLSGSHTLLVRVAAEGINPPSSDTTLLFTASVNEMAEIAVAAYEAGPITTLAEVATAEGLKTPADAAVAAVGDATAKAAFGLRVTTRAAAIASARTMLEAAAAEAALQATAETAVAAYEAGPITTLAEVATAEGLKTPADAAVAAVGDATVRAAFALRVTTRAAAIASARTALESAVAIAAINSASNAAAMSVAITTHAVAIGLNLTDYNALSEAGRVAVQTAMIAPIFTSFAQIKTTFDSAVLAQKALLAVNTSSAANMGSVITTYSTALGLTTTTLADYNLLPDASKDIVHVALAGKAFANIAAVNTAFGTAVLPQKALLAVNTASVANMGSVITTYSTALGLTTTTLTDYNLLTAASKGIVHTALEGKAFANITAVNAAFGTAVSVPIINEITVSLTMTAAIIRYNPILNLNATSYTTYTAPAAQLASSQSRVNAMLMAAVLTSTTDVQAAFDSAVTAEAVYVINIQQFNFMDRDLRTFAAQLGLVLTDFDALINKTPVLTAMVAATFTTAAQVKTTFDSLVAQEKALESLSPLEAFNSAPDAATMGNVIGIHQTIFTSSDYLMYNNTVGGVAQLAIQTAMLAPTFSTLKEVELAFVVGLVGNRTFSGLSGLLTTDAVLLGLATSTANNEFGLLTSTDRSAISSAVYLARPITDQTEIVIAVLNSTTTANYIGTLLSLNSGLLGLDLADYNALTPANKTAVQNALIAATLTNVTDVQIAFDAEVAILTP